MKRQLLSIFLIFSISAPIFAVLYQEARQNFKAALFSKQQSMSQEECYRFIEQYLVRAENELVVPAFCLHHFDDQLSQDYFESWLSYKRLAKAQEQAAFAEKVKKILESLKAKYGELHQLNVQEEFNKTIALLKEINTAFMKAVIKKVALRR